MCCGSARAAGKLPTNSYLLGEEDTRPARFVRVLDPSILPVSTGTAYVRGTGVDQAIADGLLEDAYAMQQRAATTVTKFRVTKPDGSVTEFDQYQPARLFATREGGVITLVKE